MQGKAQFLGVGAVEPLPAHSVDDFIYCTDRLEEDVGGVAARVERVTSTRLRHLFMLGVHAGATRAGLDTRGDPLPPPVLLIGKHGTLFGMPKSLWHPLAQVPKHRSTRLADYFTALQAVDGYLASDRSSPGQK
jgi:hypothetical protein